MEEKSFKITIECRDPACCDWITERTLFCDGYATFAYDETLKETRTVCHGKLNMTSLADAIVNLSLMTDGKMYKELLKAIKPEISKL